MNEANRLATEAEEAEKEDHALIAAAKSKEDTAGCQAGTRPMSESRKQNDRLLDVDEVAARCGVSVKTVRRWSAKLEHFPKPGKQGNVVRWRESEVNGFVENFGKVVESK